MFNDQHLNLVYNQEMYVPYINREFSFNNFQKQIDQKERNFSDDSRNVLVDALSKQNSNLVDKDLQDTNISLLSKGNTFTVTTGHQLSMLTGPLYFVIKILHIIKLSKELKEQYPEYNFVPIFWMASEDHDFEEIKDVKLFDNTLTWDAKQSGPVGKFELNDFTDFKEEISTLFQNSSGTEIDELLNAYHGGNLAEATRNLVHKLFGSYGLVIIDGDDIELKNAFKKVVIKELEEEFSFNIISKTNDALKKDGATIQINPREINLFYIEKGLRSRIIKDNDRYTIEGKGNFTKKELLEMLDKSPDTFSPNVALRPLYQELVLPNLAYVGGVGEISYWLQLKGVFDSMNLVYPMIGIRNSVLWIDSSISRKISKIDLKLEDIFKDSDLIKREYIESQGDLNDDFKLLERLTEELAVQIDKSIIKVGPNMGNYAASEVARLNKQLDGLKSKLLKLSKTNHENAMTSIDLIKAKLFPNGKLQERTTNFFSFCPDGNYVSKLSVLYNIIDPIENDFIVLRES